MSARGGWRGWARAVAALAAAVALASAASAQAPPGPRPEAITDGPTPLGLRLAHVRLAHETDQAFAFYWRDPSALADPTRAGLIELAPNLLVAGGGLAFDGATMDEALKDAGARLALRRTAATTMGEVVGAARHFEIALDVLHDVLARPRLPSFVLEREKASTLAGARALRERPDRLAGLALTRALVAGAPGAALLLEPPDQVAQLEVADVDTWRRATLVRDTLVVVAAGPMEREEVEQLADAAFGDLPERAEPAASPAPELVEAGRTIVLVRPVPQTVIAMGAAIVWPAEEWPARLAAAQALGGGPGARLWRAVRDGLGAGYGAYAWTQPLTEGVWRFTLQASVAPDSGVATLAAMRREYALLRMRGVEEAELGPIRARLAAREAEAMDRAGTAATAIRAALAQGRSADAPARAVEALAALTADRLNAILATRMPETPTTIVVAPSAEGFQADCVVVSLAEIPGCGLR
ncbi:MAG: insulinase family protein [Rhizobiales bacterium]|nr:insulinase family protein [Hyphomicrobiales bacterium]